MRHGAIGSTVLSFLIATAAALLISSPARADDAKKQFAGYTKYQWYRAHYDVNADGTHVEKQAWSLKVLTEQGVAEAQQASVSFSDRLQTLEIISAYTLKSDGRKIDVPKTNFQDEANVGKGDQAPIFSDIRTRTVAFPDVAVGDSVVLSYQLTQKEATFPGNFSLLESFSKFEVYDEVEISVSAPKSLGLRVYARGVEGGEAPSSDGRSNWAWSYKNQNVATPETASVSPLDYGPLIVVTTFKDYGALAAAYNARAKPKAEPTDGIRKFADDLTKNAHTPREQAKALYEWVSHNIKYVDNEVGVGSVVPHAADQVRQNRMGDCKDHTTLLQALLAAKGIASIPALINSGAAYTLPDAPSIEVFDHVISYIPSLDLFADSTSEITPFGSIPIAEAGKPVLLTANFTGIRHTPKENWKENGSYSKTVMNFHSDGSSEGETQVDAKGEYADETRYRMTYIQPNMEDSLMRSALTRNGYSGTGTLIKGNIKDISPSYRFGSSYKLIDAIDLPGPGAISLRSPIEWQGGVGSFLRGSNDPDPTVNFVCGGGYSREEFIYNLPKDVKVLAIPRNVEIKGKYQTYKATYQRKDDTVTALREIEDRTPGPVCGPEVAAEYKKFAKSVRKDLHAQLLYE
jgi:transglutaminase-like putative cysteine protease